MDKEKLVFELFKEQIKKQYIEILKVGTKVKSQNNIYWQMKEYCQKAGADYSKVRNLAEDYKRQIFKAEQGKKILHVVDYRTKGTVDIHRKIKTNLRKKQRDSVEQFLKRNSKDGNKGF